MRVKELNCYVKTSYRIIGLYIMEEEIEECGMVVCENNKLCDDIDSIDELISSYGEIYYETKEDYEKGNGKKFKDYFKKGE